MPPNRSQSSGSGTSNRGFASMDVRKQREIASKGGRSVAAEDRSFSQNRVLAAEAGRKGGRASHGGRRRPAGPAAPQPLPAAAPDELAHEAQDSRPAGERPGD